MKKPILKFFIVLLLSAIFLVSCTSEDRDRTEPLPIGDYSQGVFVLNEGGYGYSNASVSFLDTGGQVYNSIFYGVNKMNLGDVAQSMGFYEDNAYIVVNNSSTVEVVNRYSFEHVATVSHKIVNPRYIVFEGNKGYITNWGDPNNVNDDYVAVLNLSTNLVITKIPVVEGPEKLLIHNGKLYVAQKGGYGWGNTISVVDMASQKVTGIIPVGDVPDAMGINNDKLYVICSGKGDYTLDETQGKLLRINLENGNVEKTLTFPQKKHPRFLDIESNTLYYTLGNAVYATGTNNFELPPAPLFSPAAEGLEVLHGFKVQNGSIVIADAKDYVSNGEVFIYTLNGDLQNTFSVQISPNSFYFNN